MSYIKEKLLPYSVPTVFLLLGLLGICFYWIYASKHDLPVVLSIAGFTFAVFQTLLNIKIQSIRNLYQLRQSEYKNVVKILNDISDEFVKHLFETPDAKNQKAFTLLFYNKTSELITWIDLNDQYLFPDLKKKKATNLLYDELQILKDESYKGWTTAEDLAKMEKDTKVEELEVFLKLNDAKNRFGKNYKPLKYTFLLTLQKYFK